jgi:uncharacterized protein
MRRRSALICMLALATMPGAMLAQTPATKAPTLPTQKVLIHIHSADPADWNAAVAKANEYMSSAKPGTTVVELVATGDGLKLVDKANEAASSVASSLAKDVSYVACHASMKASHMAIDQLHSGVGTVPSGSAEIAQRKADGWTVLDDKATK